MHPTPFPARFAGRRRGLAAFMAVACCLVAAVARGDEATDEVHRVGGGVVRGEVSELSPNAVTITVQSGSTARIPIADVRFVRFANEPEALSNARSLLLRQDGAAALQEIAKLSESDRSTATSPMLVDLAFIKAAAGGRAAITSGTGLEEAAASLRDFIAKNARSHQVHAANETLAAVLSREGRHAEAAAAYAAMAKGPPAIAARAAALRAELQVAQGNPVEAIREYESAATAAAQVEGEGGRLARLTAELGKARCLVLLHKPVDAITACREVIQDCRPGDAPLLSRAYLVLGEAQLEAGTGDHAAAVALLTVDLVHNTVPDDRAAALYHLIGLWERTNHPERAREARQTLEATYPNSPWTKKLPAAKPS